ncbi:MAG TPA: hypothetical protein VGJ18_26200 [Gemmatimonadaceae bacterium]|jgi:hypothetical protein
MRPLLLVGLLATSAYFVVDRARSRTAGSRPPTPRAVAVDSASQDAAGTATTSSAEDLEKTGVEGLAAEQAAIRIGATRGKPSVVLLYGTECPITQSMFGDFVALAKRHPEVDFIAFATDEDLAGEVPGFLRQHGASFTPTYIREWQPGELTRAFAPLGIRIGRDWTRPLIAVRDADGRVVVQGEGVGDISPIESLLQKLADTTQSSASPVPR